MDARELRIGLYLANESGEEYSLDHNSLIDAIDCHKVNGYTLWNPIPLTEEWLLKFGFISNPYNDEYFLPNKWIIDIYKTKGNLQIHWKNVELKYVHTIQNLYFALTGEELEITKTKY